MHAEFHPQAERFRGWVDILDLVHHAEPLAHVHQADIIRAALPWVDQGGRVHRPEAFADAPLQVRRSGL
jgi:hypothetical protein